MMFFVTVLMMTVLLMVVIVMVRHLTGETVSFRILFAFRANRGGKKSKIVLR